MTTKKDQRSWALTALRRGLGREPSSIEVDAGESYHEAVLHSMDRKRRGLNLVRFSAEQLVQIILGQRGEGILNHAHTYDHELE